MTHPSPHSPRRGTPAPGKLPLTELAELKARRQPIAMVTAYDAPSGRLADAAGADMILVGDSAAMTVLGHDSTVPGDDGGDARAHARGHARRAAARSSSPTCRSARSRSPTRRRVHNAIRFVKEAGADAVKLEGAGPMLSRVQALVGAGIPVMGHIGLTPQSATMLGGFKAQGRTAAKARRSCRDALALEAAGLLRARARGGAGAGRGADHRAPDDPDDRDRRRRATCDGQVLVWHDLLGLYEGHAPRFVKQYADLATAITAARRRRTSTTSAERRFPEEQHTYGDAGRRSWRASRRR